MRLSKRKIFTAKYAKDAKEYRGETNRDGTMPCQTVRSHGTRLYLASLLTFLRGALCGECLWNLASRRAATTHDEL